MIYAILKPFIRIALFFFCRKIYIQNREALNSEGPVLITANHPNSFLDAIIIGAFFKKPIHFLARGDAFKKPVHRFLLKLLNLIPIYRLSEGKEHLYLNEYAFKESQRVLNKGGIVLIFIEGICLLTNQLQPFKKGAARIALEYQGKKPLSILPVGIAYDRFNAWGKTVQLVIGKPIEATILFPLNERAKNILYFNQQIRLMLEPLIIPPTTAASETNYGMVMCGNLGKLLQLPYFKIIHSMVQSKTKNTVYFDSILFGVLLFSYPLYLLLIGLFFYWWIGIAAFLVLVIFVLSARTIVLCKNPDL